VIRWRHHLTSGSYDHRKNPVRLAHVIALLPAWLPAAPTFLLLAAILVVPGLCLLRALRVPWLLAAAAGPAVSVGLVALLTLMFGALDVRWSLGALAATVAVLVGPVVLLGRRGNTRPQTETAPRLPRGRILIMVGCALIGFALQAHLYLSAVAAPDAILQNGDALFHLQGAALIAQSGDASSFGAVDALYGSPDRSVYYPTVWHALVALAVPVGGVTEATNALAILISAVVWPAGMVALTVIIAPRYLIAGALVPILASTITIYPVIQTFYLGIFPQGLSTALLPGAVALCIHALRASPNLCGSLAATALVACGGVVLSHPSGAVGLALFLGPASLSEGASLIRARRREGSERGRRDLLVALGPAIGIFTAMVVLLAIPQVSSMASFARSSNDVGTAILAVLNGTALTDDVSAATSILMGLTVVGAAFSLTRLSTSWLPVSWLAVAALYVAALGPDGFLRSLTGVWYKDSGRIAGLLATVTIVLAALGAGWLCSLLATTIQRVVLHGEVVPSPTLTAVVAVLVVVGLTLFTDLNRDVRYPWARMGYDSTTSTWLPPGEIAFITDLEAKLPDDAIVIGDPNNGAPYVQVLTSAQSFLPTPNPGTRNTDQDFLGDHFRDILTDPRVCEVVAEHDIGYYFEDVPHRRLPAGWPRFEGLHGVDTAHGFELVDEKGDVRLWRITGCG
jgi:hypothetical protein